MLMMESDVRLFSCTRVKSLICFFQSLNNLLVIGHWSLVIGHSIKLVSIGLYIYSVNNSQNRFYSQLVENNYTQS